MKAAWAFLLATARQFSLPLALFLVLLCPLAAFAEETPDTDNATSAVKVPTRHKPRAGKTPGRKNAAEKEPSRRAENTQSVPSDSGSQHDELYKWLAVCFVIGVTVFALKISPRIKKRRQTKFLNTLRERSPDLQLRQAPADWYMAFNAVYGEKTNKIRFLAWAVGKNVGEVKAELDLERLTAQNMAALEAMPEIMPHLKAFVSAHFPDDEYGLPVEPSVERLRLYAKDILNRGVRDAVYQEDSVSQNVDDYLAGEALADVLTKKVFGYVDPAALWRYVQLLVWQEVFDRVRRKLRAAKPDLPSEPSVAQLADAAIAAYGESKPYLALAGASYQQTGDVFRKELTQAAARRERNHKIRLAEKMLAGSRVFPGYVSIAHVDRMDGLSFEKFLGNVFAKLGYKVIITKASGDQGADLVVERLGAKTVVQAKCYGQPVSNSAVQEVVAAKTIYGAAHAMVVTNSQFTKSAKELAAANNVELWDRNELSRKLSEAQVPLERPTESNMAALKTMPCAERVDLSRAEMLAIEYARTRAAQKIDFGLGTDTAQAEKARAAIRNGIAKGIENRETWRQTMVNMRAGIGDYALNWEAITLTEMENSLQYGRGAEMLERDKGVLVAKMPRPDCCDECRKHYIDAKTGKPRIFKLSDIFINSNQAAVPTAARADRTPGRVDDDDDDHGGPYSLFEKPREMWVPTWEALHAGCSCAGVEVPDGYEFDKDWLLVPTKE